MTSPDRARLRRQFRRVQPSHHPRHAPLDEHTIFEIGSISKTFTGLLLAEAVTREEVRLDEPVAQLLPKGTKVPSRDGREITLLELSTHRSGLPRLPGNFSPANRADPYADYDATKLLDFVASYQLPPRRVAVVVLSNASVEVDDIGMHLTDPSSPLRMPPVPVHRTAVALTPAQLDRVVGDYTLAPTFILHVTRVGDDAYVQATGQPRFRLWSTSPDHFFLKEVAAQLVFDLGESGLAKSVTLLQNGASQTAPRKP